MTRDELRMERQLEKIRVKIVNAEIARSKREECIKEHVDTILSVMTAIMFSLLIFVAFFVDAFGFAEIPFWVYVIGMLYMIVYLIIAIKKYTK